jgi:DNA-binding CsgD family transcriptional regulator
MLKQNSPDYNLFFKFIEAFSTDAFQGIDRNNTLLLELEKMMEKNNQFFFVADILKMKIIFCTNQSKQMIGVEPENITPYDLTIATHPDDASRMGSGTSKMFNLANNIFIAEKGTALLSTNIRIRNPLGKYPDLLFQLYLFYNTIPYKSVFLLQVHTDIGLDNNRKHGYHYYVGNDMTYFRYPDEELLSMGVPFSDREFEIIKLIASGLGSEQIAEELFLSIHTVNTHRKNILSKAGKKTISELSYDLVERGLL